MPVRSTYRTTAGAVVLSLLLAAALVLGTLAPAASAASPADWTIFVTRDGYQPAKFEPVSGAYLGGYVIQDEYIGADMNKFNELTEKRHASFFRYVGYGRPFPTEWVEEVKAAGAVPHIAFEPNNGLDEVVDNDYLRQWARDARAAGVPIFLRYASEMNGTWTQYSGKSKLYKEKWKLVHKVMKEEAPNVAMVWTVFTFPEQTITAFYPGDEYVDWVGVNIYNVVYHNDNINVRGDKEDPLDLLNYVYNTYSARKPIQISEFGATHYTVTDDSFHIDFAVEKIKRLYENLPVLYPRVKSIYYFDVNNLVNAPDGRKINDYSITNDERVLAAYRDSVAGKYYLTSVTEQPDKPRRELFTTRGILFQYNGRVYADVSFFREQLGLQVTVKGRTATVQSGNKTKSFSIVNRSVPKGAYNEYRQVNGLPVKDVALAFGFQFNADLAKNYIYIKKA